MADAVSTQMYPPGKIDIHKRQAQFQRALIRLDSDQNIIPENKKLIQHFIRDCSLGKTIRKGTKKKIGPARCLKYISLLSRISFELGKPFDSVTQSDMEKFISRLENGQVKSVLERTLSDETRADFKKAIKKFWKWKDGNNTHYPEVVEWLDTSVRVKDISALSRVEIDQLIAATDSAKLKALVMVLFDSGARIEELLNVRLKEEHLRWSDEYECYLIRLEFSKTKPRTISLPLSNSYLKNWVEAHPEQNDTAAQLFPIKYASVLKTLGRLGDKALGKRVTPHILRHSSATHFANVLSHFQLCHRYGWAMSSDMVNRYIDRSGILEEQTVQLIKTSEKSSQGYSQSIVEGSAITSKDFNSSKADRHLSSAPFSSDQDLLRTLVTHQQALAKALEGLTGQKFDIVLPEL